MEEKGKRILKICLLLIVLIIPFAYLSFVKADAGWDTDYGGGGGGGYSDWGGGGGYDGGYSSWDSDSYHSSRSGSYYSSGTSATLFTLFLFVLIVVILIACFNNKNYARKESKYMQFADPSYHDMDIEKLKDIVPDMSIGDIKNMVYNNFIDVQNAWMEFDYDKLRELCTDELFNTYKAQLETLKLKKGKNIMTAFEMIDIKITDAIIENDNVILTAYLCINFYDYVINTDTKQTIRGTKDSRVHNNYILTFVRSSNVGTGKDNKCPNCGAPINDKASDVCEYCKSTIVKDSEKFVLSKKNIIN